MYQVLVTVNIPVWDSQVFDVQSHNAMISLPESDAVTSAAWLGEKYEKCHGKHVEDMGWMIAMFCHVCVCEKVSGDMIATFSGNVDEFCNVASPFCNVPLVFGVLGAALC